jgi:hypothetical protein
MTARVFVIGTDADLVAGLLRDLGASGYVAEGGTDARKVREWLAAGPVSAVLLDERLARPTAAEIAAALKRALPASTAYLLLSSEVRDLESGTPFHACIRAPVARPVLADRLRRAIVAAAAVPTSVNPALLAELELRAGRIDRQNHYEVLGVGPKAPTDRIRDAYDRLALVFHPDRIQAIEDPEVRDRVATIYSRIAEAWRVLRDGSDRARYDRELASGTRTTTRTGAILGLEDFSANPNTRKYLKLAQQAIAERNHSMALVHLNFALQLEPENTFISNRIREIQSNQPT